MSSNNHNGHAVPTAPGSTILRVPSAQPQQPQPATQPHTAPIGVAPAPPLTQPQQQQPQIQLMPVGGHLVSGPPVQAPKAPTQANPIAGVTKIVQDNKRELIFAGAGAFLATMFANGNTPRFPGGGGGRT